MWTEQHVVGKANNRVRTEQEIVKRGSRVWTEQGEMGWGQCWKWDESAHDTLISRDKCKYP